jgi:hypothetical protein
MIFSFDFFFQLNVQFKIMVNDRYPIFCQLHIKFNEISTQVSRHYKRHQRVLFDAHQTVFGSGFVLGFAQTTVAHVQRAFSGVGPIRAVHVFQCVFDGKARFGNGVGQGDGTTNARRRVGNAWLLMVVDGQY